MTECSNEMKIYFKTQIIYFRDHAKDLDEPDIEQRVAHLTAEQRTAFNEIISSVQTKQPKLYFLDAPGGCGKTHLLNVIIDYLRINGWLTHKTPHLKGTN